MKVAFQGEPGAFSEEAALAAFPGAQSVGFDTFDGAANALHEGEVAVACLPVENTLFGSIGRTYDLIAALALRIVQMRVLHVRQCLIAPRLVALDAVRTVASHPVALEQCRSLFARWPSMKQVVTHDTAGSVRAMMDGTLAVDACIAGAFAAQRYGAHVIRADVHDDPSNFTRFFLVRRASDVHVEDGDSNATHATIGVELPNRPGSLGGALSVLAEAGINLTNLVCRPLVSKPWSYRFFFELEAGPDAAAAAASALGTVGTATVYGCYRAVDAETGAARDADV